MSKSKSKRGSDKDRELSRPEDPDTQRLRSTARLRRASALPEAARIVAEAEHEDSETAAALRRATDARERGDSGA
jgi:hypothetical protein